MIIGKGIIKSGRKSLDSPHAKAIDIATMIR
jgi:hypothetical protein